MTTVAAGINVKHVRTVAINVSDQDKALDFYVGVLGFEKRLDVPFNNGMRWIEIGIPGSDTSLSLPPRCPENPAQPGGDTGIRLGTANAEEDHAYLKSQGADVDDQVLNFGEGVPPMFSLRDPDGNTLFIVEEN